MFYDEQLTFLCNVFKKSRVHTSVIERRDLADAVKDFRLESVFGKTISDDRTLGHIFGELSARTVYKLTDTFGFCYIYFLLPSTENSTLLLIGPYFTSALSHEQMLEIGEMSGVSPKQQKYLEEYFASVAVLGNDSGLFVMLDTFCELIWQSPSFDIIDVNKRENVSAASVNEFEHNEGAEDILVNMKAMETRYAFENDMIRAVSLGQLHMEKNMLSELSDHLFEKRVSDPSRNAKNYGVIMNTLLRKAAEKGGVHPIYLDKVSSKFAFKIENMPSVSEFSPLMREMFREYCYLVREHSIKNLPSIVQKAVIIIEADLSADISLSTLAEELGISAGYLSAVFKKATGKTVSEYIRDKRMKYAAYLLETTNLQVQTVALHCGILDVQYFSKLFKEHTKRTPTQYRLYHRKSPQSTQ